MMSNPRDTRTWGCRIGIRMIGPKYSTVLGGKFRPPRFFTESGVTPLS